MSHFQNSVSFENGFGKTSFLAGFSTKSKVAFMEHSLLVQNEEKRLHISMPLLLTLAMSLISQMGIMFHSSQTLSLNDRASPLVTLGDVSLYIAAAYFLSSAFVYLFPRFIVQTGRLTN